MFDQKSGPFTFTKLPLMRIIAVLMERKEQSLRIVYLWAKWNMSRNKPRREGKMNNNNNKNNSNNNNNNNRYTIDLT
jgi:hypothetical protein